MYRRTWGGGDSATAGELGECALGAVQARLRHLAARSLPPSVESLKELNKSK
ncbi:hypothetical protein JYU34_021227 [Plutella xylostella]|uniref:Uncharacterized protein n=1 Tax=Plutella xylostella TaxID=51655 RepID=A0ABQ7PUL3_PLUXY|nr:hypothetical protein JYU34_021227 [Plutella xylostella]